ncbi:27723_t:CDS:2, partial [Dentiscutata erythropus]
MSTPRKRKEPVTPSGRSNKKRTRPTGLTETEPEAEINREISNLTEETQEGAQEETQEGIQGTQRGIQEEIFPEGRTRNPTLDKLISQNAE